MIRVLHIAGLNRGGLETFIMNVYRKIDRSKIQFDFLTNTPDGDYAEEVRDLGGRIYGIQPRNKGFCAYYRSLDSFFKEHANEYQAVHMHVSSLSSAPTLFYPKKYGVKTRVIHSHSSSMLGNKLHCVLHYMTKPFVGRLATHYLGCSDKALDWLYEYTGIRSKAQMINNGIDVRQFKYNEVRRKKMRELLCLEDSIVLGHIGRFTTVKNHLFLLNIYHAFHKIHPQSKLLLIGDGELMGAVKERTIQLGIEKMVSFLGVRADIADLLQAMDIFVMPSLYEGLPISLVEAQASGLPVLATDIISKDTKMTEGFHYISLSQSEEIWANKISDILSSYKRCDTSEEIIRNGFDINTTVLFLNNLYLNG